ncbi:MAG: VWA domain-containing protein [Treponema sp.]|nr:VWA domain-containing protein [Treponema sp.]MCI5665974.1 VWA domain-containing protein [Spirochaetia bacterium]MDD7769322.1 VWA domain-containing protein [Treponema sp.]MDY3130574.1 VWA domain-containing protein [Treponema sp.]
MGMFDDIDGIVKRQMVLFFVVDTSGSMQGTKIGAVNTAIREVLPELKDAGGADIDLKVACLTFSSGCQWMYPTPIASDSFQWTTVDADGVTDLGAACRELNDKLSKNGFLKAPSGSVAPVIFLLSDGEPTDDFESGINLLQQNNWFKHGIKVAVAIGDDANKDVLAKFTGNIEAVITVHTPEALRKWIRKVSITSSQIGSRSQPVSDGQLPSKQDTMIDEIKDIQQEEPDLSSTSTSGDDW